MRMERDREWARSSRPGRGANNVAEEVQVEAEKGECGGPRASGRGRRLDFGAEREAW